MVLKKTKKRVVQFGTAVVGLGVGSSVLGSAQGTTSNATASNILGSGQQGLQNIGGFAPVVGTAIGGAGALESLKLLGIKKTKRKRR
jgi:hypothetical protein